MAEITIIVPVYKVEQFLQRCIDSVLNQTYSDFDVILVDDGSPDDCPALCEEFAKRDSRIQVIHQENMGLAAARNTGLQWANEYSDSRWVTFLDSDDLMHPQMLEILYKAIVDHCADISVCNAVEATQVPVDFFASRNPDIVGIASSEKSMLDLYFNGRYRYWTAWGKLIRKSIVTAYPFECGRIYEDNNVVFKWLCTAKRIADVKDSLYFYYINPEGISKKKYSLKSLDYLHALESQISFYCNIGYFQLYNELSRRYVVDLAYAYRSIKNELKDIAGARKLRRKLFLFVVTNYRKVRFAREDFVRIQNIMEPFYLKVYYYSKAAIGIAQRDGVGVLFMKLFRRMNRSNKR